jgi:hypothetical protein
MLGLPSLDRVNNRVAREVSSREFDIRNRTGKLTIISTNDLGPLQAFKL